MKVQALKVKETAQSMVPGKVYEVTTETGGILLKVGRAVEAAPDMEVGEVYDLPKPKKTKKTDPLLG